MSKAERYIELVSDENGHLCDQHALKAVEIEREEIIKKVCEYIAFNMRCDGYTLQTKSKFIKDLKQAMKYEEENL